MTWPSLIDQWFPAPEISEESMRERRAFTALPAPFAIHVWFARRPLITSRAAMLGALLPAWPSVEEAEQDDTARGVRAGLLGDFEDEATYRRWFLRAAGVLGDPLAGQRAIKAAKAAGVRTKGNAYGYDRAFTISPDAATIAQVHRLAGLRADLAKPPVLLDFFAGGGSIPFEATRYGCSTIASELNPVAAAILQGTVVLPATLGPEFVHEIKRWGDRWVEKVRERLGQFFPVEHENERNAFIWAHTVPCPKTGRPTPLIPDHWLARADGQTRTAVSLLVDKAAGTIDCRVVTGADAELAGPLRTYKDGVGSSVWADTTFDGDYIQGHARAGNVGELLLAVSVTRQGTVGRRFRAPTAADRAAVIAASAELQRKLPGWEIDDLVPVEAVFEGKETKRSVDMGIVQWSQMFSPRQLLTNLTALEALHEIGAEARAAIGPEKARSVALYLAFALDKAVDYNGILSSWDATRVKVRNTFDRHDFAYKWTFAEFDGARSLLPWTVSQATRTYEASARLAVRPETLIDSGHRAAATVIRGSAAALPLADNSVDLIVTDPPYYDNVMYAECSDYFYVWLKRALRDSWPELTDLVLTDKIEEAVSNPSLFREAATHRGRGKRAPGAKTADELGDARYEELLTASFREAKRLLKPDGTLLVMFTHKKVTAWDTLGRSLLEAGFAVTSSWPVRTESELSLHQAKKNSAQSTILLACRHRVDAEPSYWADIRGDVERAAEEAVTSFAPIGLTGVDLTLATFGPVLEVLSRRWPVYTGALTAEGERELLRPDDALNVARERVAVLKKRGLVGGRDVTFDPVTDWYLLAWNDFQAAEFPSPEALKLCLATHLDLDDLSKKHKVIKATSGSTTILTPGQRRTAGGLDPDASSWPTKLDALHALMLTLDEAGLSAARALAARKGLEDDQVFRDLVRAAINAIPLTQDNKGDYLRQEARMLVSLCATIFDDIPVPQPDLVSSSDQLEFAEEPEAELGSVDED